MGDYAFRIIRTYYYLAKSKDIADPLKSLSDFIQEENFEEMKNGTANDGNTVLDLAAMEGDLEFVEVMIKELKNEPDEIDLEFELKNEPDEIMKSFSKAMCRKNEICVKTLLNGCEKILSTDVVKKYIEQLLREVGHQNDPEQVELWHKCFGWKANDILKENAEYLFCRAVMRRNKKMIKLWKEYLEGYLDGSNEFLEKLYRCTDMPKKLDRINGLINIFGDKYRDKVIDIVKEDICDLFKDAVPKNKLNTINALLTNFKDKIGDAIKEDVKNLLYEPIYKNNADMIEVLVKYFKDIDAGFFKTNEAKELFRSAVKRKKEMVEAFLNGFEDKTVATNFVKEDAQNLLSLAVERNNTEMLEVLLGCLGDEASGFVNEDFGALLKWALVKNNPDMATVLLKYREAKSVEFSDIEEGLFLQDAVKENTPAMLKLFLVYRKDATPRFVGDAESALLSAVNKKNKEMVVLLLQYLGGKVSDANLNLICEYAMWVKTPEIVGAVFEYGEDKVKEYIFTKAIDKNNLKIVTLLLEYWGIGVIQYREKLLNLAKEKGNQEIVKAIEEAPTPRRRDLKSEDGFQKTGGKSVPPEETANIEIENDKGNTASIEIENDK